MEKPRKLKHQDNLCRIPGCPPAHAVKRNISSYRFVVQGRPKQLNFIPAALLNPSRCNRGAFLKNHKLRCSSYALSFYANKHDAIQKLISLIQKVGPNFQKRVGNAVGELELKPHHGLTTQPSADSHFDLHEFQNSQLTDQPIKLVWRSDTP